MKKLSIYIVAATILFGCKSTETTTKQDVATTQTVAPAPQTKPIEVVELKQPQSNKVVVKLMFKNGSTADPKGKEGLTYATAQLIAQGGTAQLTNAQIQDKIYPMAAGYGASVDKEVSIFTFQVPTDFLMEFYPIMRDLMLSPSMTEEDFSRVKSNQMNFVSQVIRASSDEEYSKKALEDLLFRGTNYQHMVEGKTESVKNITLEDVKQHYRNFFTKNNLMLGVAGNYPDEFVRTLKADMERLSGTVPPIPAPGKPNQPNGMVVEIIKKDNALGSAVFTGFPMPVTRSSDDFAALMVANSYLGEHRKSYGKLYDKIRTTRSMNYGDYSYIEWYEAGGSNMLPPSGTPRTSNYFAIWLRPVQIAEGLKQQYKELNNIEVGHAHFALRLAVRELDNLIKNGMSQEDFELTRQFLRSYMKLYIQSPGKQLGYLMDSRFYNRQDYIKEMDQLLASLTVEDVNRAVKKYWQTQNMYITIVTDDSEAAPLAEALRTNKPSPMSYSNLVKEGLPKEVLAEDDEIAKYPLNITKVTVVESDQTFQ
ncbi:MAG: insulinase family protein [Hymenobacteraceae bacterium]|nr:insulinase family protein [Hymenobacteraceae bacterium]MDX5394808.1 insulinase family protein [Hymenobacteraceae bacterium]MDX5443231.1 insulinase family protein [Hymenobacteraceae bacterium]MDX5510840.1 insulinase family protein [Hymenobacteraceae bacterium]